MILQPKDIHSHILPGVDDGFQTPEDSLKALSDMAAAGVKEVVLTPHLNPDVFPNGSEDKMKAAYDAFSAKIPRDLGLKTSLAAEYMVVNGFEKRVAEEADKLLTYDDGSILIEMSYYYPSANIEQAIFELVFAGFKPILAHPERYTYLAGDLKEFDRYIDMGCRLQMNYMSLAGVYGEDSLRILKYLLSGNMYSFIATDLHGNFQLERILEMKPVSRKIRKLMEEKFGI